MSSDNATSANVSPNQLAGTIFSSLKHRNFKWYCAGVLASLTGSLMQELVVAWVAYQMTGSSFVLGTILFCFQVPMLVMGLVGGWAADRYDRKTIIVVTQIAALTVSLTWLTLSMTGLLAVWHLYALSAVFGIIVAFEIPARFAVIPQLVSGEDTLNAFALDSLLFYSGRVFGPALAAVMLSNFGPTGCFAINALTYMFELFTLYFLLPKAVEKTAAPGLAEGFRFAYGTPAIRRMVMLVAVFSFCGVYIPLMPVFTTLLQGNESTNGLLVACSEIGAVVGSLLLAFLTASRARSASLTKYIGIAGITYAVFLAIFSLSRSVPISMMALIPLGFSMTILLIGSHAIVQNHTEDRMRGVISTVFWMYSYFGMFALGGPTIGWLTEVFGATPTYCAMACICGCAALIYMISDRQAKKKVA